MDQAAQYLITNTFWHHHYNVSTKDETHLFHVDNSSLTIGKPDLTFHRSPDSNGPIAGVCKFRHFSSDCEIGLGDPERPSEMDWEYLHKQGFIKRIYWFRMQLEDGTKQNFTWKRTHSLGTGREKYKLVEETSQTVVAVFSSGRTFSKTPGYLDIYLPLGPRFNLIALISGIAVAERARRARKTKTSQGGGGGGGSC
ncbi:hypothetical protein N7447_011037 [Penicillium robsamsonii]|uniref:uncharacterized protein n=1 Tax=Penicillium robsamsonii TaxID=1792511 RepID=UPI002547E8AC|nr:uncharacterized protein N7447_011037 [Penicillium robsamsonii]KAJ5807581.1 hypothetical protein N7447_011037 [Penicillium robsamsonii]